MTDNVAKVRQILKLNWEIMQDTDLDGDFLDAVMNPANCDPFQNMRVGFYEFGYDESRGFIANYLPVAHQDAWIMNVDLDQIVSFEKPPKEKEPCADQSNQGSTTT